MLRIGIDSFIWSEIFEEKDLWIINKAKELGFPFLEIAIAEPFTFPLAAVKERMLEVGIEIGTSTTLPAETNPISPDPACRKAAVKSLKRLIDINRELGAKYLCGVNYAAWQYFTGKPRTQQEWDWSLEVMREVAQYAKDYSETTICVEVINRFESHFLNCAQDAVQYCKDSGMDNVKVHLDCFHMIGEEESYSKAVETCRGYLGYVHVCESNRGIPGKGMVPFKEFFNALYAIGYDGPCVIESFDPSFEKLSSGTALWRKFAPSGEYLAIEGKKYLEGVLAEIEAERTANK